MATKTKDQIQIESNLTYIDNTVGQITPSSVRTLNTDWIDSIVFTSQTSSLIFPSASYALTASVLLGGVQNAIYAERANTANTATSSLTSGYANGASSATSSISSSYSSVANTAYSATSSISSSYAVNADNVNATGVNGNQQYHVAFVSGIADGNQPIYFDANDLNYNANSNLLTGTITNAYTASNTPNAVVTASAVDTTITFTRGNGTTFSVTVSQSGSVASASYANFAENAGLLDNLDSTSFVFTSSFNTFSGSVATRFGLAPTLAGDNTFTGNNIFGNVTASNALITSASVQNLTVIYETASVIYSSGSNQFGDAANDVQTLWGRVDIKSGPVTITGSVNASAGFTGNLTGTSSWASNAVNANTASYVVTAQTASYYGGTVATASYAINANNAYAATSSISASYATVANSVNALSQSLVITGSFNGLVVSQSIASNTSSLNFSTANFFTSAVTSNTFFNITNPKPGETVNVLLTTVGAATASFSSNVKQVSGSAYQPTAGDAKKDILTFVSWDGTSVYLANIKNLV